MQMNEITRYLAEMNILLWVLGLLFFHGLLYYVLGTPNWLGVTLVATGVWAAGLIILKAVSKARLKENA